MNWHRLVLCRCSCCVGVRSRVLGADLLCKMRNFCCPFRSITCRPMPTKGSMARVESPILTMWNSLDF